jgi:predicted RNA-binding Zn ribbon-like protein
MTDSDLIVAFLETRTVPDPVGTPAQLEGWLRAHGLWNEGKTPSEADVSRARHLRAAIISLLREGADADPRTRATIEEVVRNAPLAVTLEGLRSLKLAPSGGGVDGALAEIVAALYRIGLRGDLKRIKACKRCGFAFYDTTKNRSRIWCDMGTCGSQEKARAYRERHRGEPAAH